jgi:Zn-dependent M28 family amino/carboxypeptidase
MQSHLESFASIFRLGRKVLPCFVIFVLLGGHVTAGAAVDGEAAFAHLVAQCEFGPRTPGSPGHAACLTYIKETLTASGARLTLQTFSHQMPESGETLSLTNVIARFGPLRSGGVLLGAHWDTRPWADMEADSSLHEKPILGANDGASGTGLLLALAESFRRDPPPIPVTLVFFDGEDLGRSGSPEEYLAGSQYFATQLLEQPPEFAFIIDMVASRTMVLALEQQSRVLFEDVALLVDNLAATCGVNGYTPGSGPLVLDDHIPLIRAGIPALLLIDFRDPVWHTLADLPENCSPIPMGQVGQLLDRLIRGGYFR